MRHILPIIACAVACTALAANSVTRTFRPERHDRGSTNLAKNIQPIDDAAWVWMPGLATPPLLSNDTRPDALRKAPSHFLKFRRTFAAVPGEKLTVDISADERFTLFLDGEFVARGPHRGLPNRWYYQTYEIDLAPGDHVLDAVVWRLGEHAPLAQLSLGGGFILKASGSYDKVLTTGKAPWKVARLQNTTMTDKGDSRTFGVGSQCLVRGCSFGGEEPAAADWREAETVREPVTKNRLLVAGIITQGWMLFPTELPDQLHEVKSPGAVKAVRHDCDAKIPYAEEDARAPEVAAFNALLSKGEAVTVPANATLRLVWDLGVYHCAYPELEVSGGKDATIDWGWVESLRDAKGNKHDRRAFAGLLFSRGLVDTFVADGRDRAFFTAPWWRCGKWMQLTIKTADAPLTIRRLAIDETRYPTPPTAEFSCSDPSISDVIPICTRGMQMCMHEMFFDCPFYEQQMYPGDSRVQFLTVNFLNADDRLIRHAIGLYDFDRRENGMIAMNTPTRGTQESSTYTMCWLMMFRDYVKWHANEAWLKARMPGMTHTLLGLGQYENADGLVQDLPGWSFVDWVRKVGGSPRDWGDGVAPSGHRGEGVSSVNNLCYLYCIEAAADVCAALGQDDLSACWRAKAKRLGKQIVDTFWSDARGMLADDAAKKNFSEHALSLALTLGILPPEKRDAAFRGLVEAKDLARCTVYFSHYLFETYFACGRPDLFLKRLDLWRDFAAAGATTPFEAPGNSTVRSDCHAWGSHPLYHLHHGIAGVEPAAPFFAKVKIAPQPGPLAWYKAKTPHPKGFIEQDLQFRDGRATGTISLPDGIAGTFEWKGRTIPLAAGRATRISCPD